MIRMVSGREMGKRDELVRAYIGALDIRALVVMTAATGQPSRVASEPVKNLDIVETFWFAKPQHAELVHASAVSDFEAIGAMRPKGWIDLPGREVRDRIAQVAAFLGAPIRSKTQMQADAEKSVDRIIENVERARIKGELKTVNAEYKIYRQRQLSAGVKPIGYGEHLAKFTLSLVVLAAQNANAAGLRHPESVAE